MAWFTRYTRFRDVHLVYGQEAENSCGIACVMMSVFKINKLAPGRSALHTEQEIYRVYGEVSGSAYNGSAYTFTNHLASVLNRLNCGQWRQEQLGTNDVAQKILDVVGTRSALTGATISVDPIIVLINWDNSGGHFVVIDSVRTLLSYNYATVCDPWDANVHVTSFSAGQPFRYEGAPVPYSWNVGAAPRAYSAPSSGGATGGWVIYRTRS